MKNKNLKAGLMPLRRAVFLLTGEANSDDDQGIRRAVRRWHNRLANGSVPRTLFRKIGKELFISVPDFEAWIEKK